MTNLGNDRNDDAQLTTMQSSVVVPLYKRLAALSKYSSRKQAVCSDLLRCLHHSAGEGDETHQNVMRSV